MTRLMQIGVAAFLGGSQDNLLGNAFIAWQNLIAEIKRQLRHSRTADKQMLLLEMVAGTQSMYAIQWELVKGKLRMCQSHLSARCAESSFLKVMKSLSAQSYLLDSMRYCCEFEER